MLSFGRTPSLDLSPAMWLWYPSERCLANTFVLFRKSVALGAGVRTARGWIAADSRYLLHVNGHRVQWGPAPCDPRWMDADPIDLASHLQVGSNVIAVTVLHYGHGDGTWPAGKPGFLFRLEIALADGTTELITSDESWRVHLARAWTPGHYKRWYLRSLQEEFDARRYPYGWDTASFKPDANWLSPMVLSCPANMPPICSTYDAYVDGYSPTDLSACELRRRSIPPMAEAWVPAAQLSESLWLRWTRPVDEYFDYSVPDAFAVERTPCATGAGPGAWRVQLDGSRGASLVFELGEQVVGWPAFTIEAAEGTVVELLVHEAHQPGGPALLNTHYYSWSRFICRAGSNRFEEFDFESCRWIQLHIHGPAGAVTVSDVGVRRRTAQWPHQPAVAVSDPAVQRLLEASVNTLRNCAQDICTDGMARERQQYSGDVGHQTLALYLGCGETRLPRRFIATFSQGQAHAGFYLDCWPAYDRLARLAQRQLGLTPWGPILDHGIQHVFDCWNHYLYTGELDALAEPYPRLLKQCAYLDGNRDPNGLLPVENLGVPSVWMDHWAYERQCHKQCAYNLYVAAMLEHGLAPICRAFGDAAAADKASTLGRAILAASTNCFWDTDRGMFVANRPWMAAEKRVRLCDRSLANAILFGQCPGAKIGPALQALIECPPEMGFSYPANAGWRLWALIKCGRPDVVLADLRSRWSAMDSVRLNNTLQEDWTAAPDTGSQWSHCPVAPMYVTYMGLAGITPLEPGFSRVQIRPQMGDLESLVLPAHTVRGPIRFAGQGPLGARSLEVALPPECVGELVLPAAERPTGVPPLGGVTQETRRYLLAAGSTTRLSTSHC